MKHTTKIFRIMILLILALALSSNCENRVSATLLSNVTDQEALLSFKAYVTGDPNGVLISWNHSIHFCQWKGVTCSRRHQRVTVLDLSSQQLYGSLSAHIGNLSFLKEVNLQKNNFRGSIPGEIGKLFRLQYLHLGSNSFEGGFPMNLSHCINIRNIIIEENNLGGRLPTEFISWSNLDRFSVSKNHFTGSIPSSFGNLSSLHIFDIGSNNLTGRIPVEIAHLPKLEKLVLSENYLFGLVPLQLYNISSLSYVALTGNMLEGRLPANLGFTLPNLQIFLAEYNKFSGPFPLFISNASKLQNLAISHNNISGPLSMNLGSLPSIEKLNLCHNPLGHNQVPGGLSFLRSLVNSTRIKYLGLARSGLRGELPSFIVNISTLDRLSINDNYIFGSIPREIGKLSNLIQLKLSQNMLTGSIPESMCKLSLLGRLYLIDNNISGVVPTCINNISGLFLLTLSNNMLHGSIPAALGNISTLQVLALDNNRLSGVIPEQIMGLSSLCVGLYLERNLLTGPLPSHTGGLTHLVGLDLSGNKITGEIPSSLGYSVMLEKLYMEGNLLEGRIPSTFKALKNLLFLDLSNNNLAGEIPHFLGELHRMQFLNLSHNKFRGEVPTNGLFSNISAFSVDRNLEICGGIPALKLPACPANKSSKKKQFRLKIVLLIVLLHLAAMLACFCIVFYRIKKSKQKKIRTLVLQDDQHPRLSYQDLLLATTDFSAMNLLGKGRYGVVYKGILESMHQIVAVKVINAEVRGANKTFLAECETLRNIRHRNLIKIITACSSTDYQGNDFKALVFEFMTNGSLDTWLHRSPFDQENERNLTLFQRLNIANDVALALDYLHHQCHKKIIHCDIKPGNILLDEDFVARVTDFGLARFFPTNAGDINQAQTSSTCVRGTVGYVPPEYGTGGEISAKGDVYSYGILLLEMFTGQRPTGGTILMDHSNNLHEYVKKALPSQVMKIADPQIILEHENQGSLENESVGWSRISNRIELCLALVFEVGVLCSAEMPRERIDMNVAIKLLHVARDKLLYG